MIIVEGPDGAGKTTLVDELCNNLRYKKGQRSVVNREDLFKVTRQDCYMALARAVNPLKQHNPMPEIWDRMFFSELVYWSYTTGECQFTMKEQDYIRKVLEAMQVPIVVCLPPLEVVLENIAKSEKDQTHYAVSAAEEIYEKYDDLRFPMQAVYYDYTNDNGALQAIYQKIADYESTRAQRMVPR